MEAINTQSKFKIAGNLIMWIKKRKYSLLLLSFLLLQFGTTFSYSRINFLIDVYQNFIIGLLIFYAKKWIRYFLICVILVSVFLDVFQNKLGFFNTASLHASLYLIFFALITKEVFTEVLYFKTVSRELLAAAMCGFVLLCLIANFLFDVIEVKAPNSFSNLGNNPLGNLNYFSFTTLLTIGYGDITPVSDIAKRAVMFIGLIGHFYTVFIISIIIGKYLSMKIDEETGRD